MKGKNSTPRVTKFGHISKISHIWAYLIKASNSSGILRGKGKAIGRCYSVDVPQFPVQDSQKKETCIFLQKPTSSIIFQLKQGRGTESASGACKEAARQFRTIKFTLEP